LPPSGLRSERGWEIWYHSSNVLVGGCNLIDHLWKKVINSRFEYRQALPRYEFSVDSPNDLMNAEELLKRTSDRRQDDESLVKPLEHYLKHLRVGRRTSTDHADTLPSDFLSAHAYFYAKPIALIDTIGYRTCFVSEMFHGDTKESRGIFTRKADHGRHRIAPLC
jgi:hypothetical protein